MLHFHFKIFHGNVNGLTIVQKAKFRWPSVTVIVLDRISAVIRVYMMSTVLLDGMEQQYFAEDHVLIVAVCSIILLCVGGPVHVEMEKGAGQGLRSCVEYEKARGISLKW